MSEPTQTAGLATSEQALLRPFDPTQNPKAQPKQNLKDFAGQNITIIHCSIEEGKEYNSTHLTIKTDYNNKEVSVMTYSKLVEASVRDILAQAAYPCRVKLLTSGKALYFGIAQ